MYDPHLYVRTLSEFTGLLLSHYEVHSALGALTDRISDVFHLAGSGVSLARDGRLEFETAFGSTVAEVERTQERTQVGPCVTALHTGETVTVTDLTREQDRWPEFTAAAARAGISAAASLPMRLEEHIVGALNLYSRGTRDWPEEDMAAAQVMADMATAFLINADRDRKQTELNRQLQIALDRRVIIEQAKGVIATNHQITPAAAFERLRNYSRSHNVSVRDLAEAVVEKRLEL